MNKYTIFSAYGYPIGDVYAISERAALIVWRANASRHGVSARRSNDIGDDVCEMTARHLPEARRAALSPRDAYRLANGFVRDLMARDVLGEHFGRNE